MRLLGRRVECEALDRLLADALAGRSRVTVLRGEVGSGKSALLGYVSDRVSGWHIAKAAGVESEMELGYSGLHQLCAPMLDHLDRLPVPQRNALATVFGRSAGPAPDRLLVGLATLSLFADVAEQHPLVCIVDDAHWLDPASAQILGFVARRLCAERVAIVCAARTGIGDHVLAGLPTMQIRGLGDSDARALLLDNMHGALDAAVCDQIIKESHGNPLALLELPRTWTAVELAGGFGLPDSRPGDGMIEERLVERLGQLSSDARLLVLAAAAEPLGDPVLLHRAAGTLGLGVAAADAAVDAGLLKIGGRIEFAHPLVRSAAYSAAAAADRHRVHRALAEAVNTETDPDRHAWHRAQATPGPDEDVAYELEQTAGRAQARGGLAAAAAFLRRSVALTSDATRRVRRALAAAQANLQAGALEEALSLARAAEAEPLDELRRAQVDLLRIQIAYAQERAGDAPSRLLAAAKRFEPLDVGAVRDIYLDALSAGVLLGRMPGCAGVVEVAGSAAAAAPHQPARPPDLLLEGFATRFTEGYAAAAPVLKQAVSAYVRKDVPEDDDIRRLWLAGHAAWHLWDDHSWQLLAARHLELVRGVGALAELPFALSMASAAHVFAGELDAAATLNHETQALSEAGGSRFPPIADLVLAAWSGREPESARLVRRDGWGADRADRGPPVLADWARALLLNGLGQYNEALASATRASERPDDLVGSNLGLIELVMAATRIGKTGVAADALRRLLEITSASGTDWALGTAARSRALLEGESADALYREAIERLSRTRVRTELARTHLTYGEWLRREGRRVDAREQLRTAHQMLETMGLTVFAAGARRELLATGETVRKRGDETRYQLTAQERQIAQLARDGLSNPEIGTRLFISPRTVEWHLRKVFTKLGIGSRRQLRAVLVERGRPVART